MPDHRSLLRLCALVALTLFCAAGQTGGPGPARVAARGEGTLLSIPLIASAVDIAPHSRLWTGTTDADKPMSFRVSPDGSEWSEFNITIKHFAPGCNARGVLDMSAPGPAPISDGQFSYGDHYLAFTGELDSAATAHGTYDLHCPVVISLPAPPYVCYATAVASGTWTANWP